MQKSRSQTCRKSREEEKNFFLRRTECGRLPVVAPIDFPSCRKFSSCDGLNADDFQLQRRSIETDFLLAGNRREEIDERKSDFLLTGNRLRGIDADCGSRGNCQLRNEIAKID